MSRDPLIQCEIDEAELTRYREKGYLLLPGLLSADDVARLRQETMDIMEAIGLGVTKLRQSTEYLRDSAIDALVNSKRLRTIASTLMEGPAHLYMPFTAVKSGSDAGKGGGEFHFHQDNQYTRFDGPGINLWFALTPMNEENGCLRIVPGSHLSGTLPSEESPDRDGHRKVTFEPSDAESILMNPGDCVAFTRLTVHGSGPNLSPEHRVAYAIQFHREDVRYTADGGTTWLLARDNPRWRTGPVEQISRPKEKADGH